MSRKILFTRNQALKGPFAFGTQLGYSCGVTHVEASPFGTLPGEVNGATAPFCRLRIFYESLGSPARQNRNIANW